MTRATDEAHHDTPICPRVLDSGKACGCPLNVVDTPIGTMAPGQALCIGCGEVVNISLVDWHRARRADQHYYEHENDPAYPVRKPRRKPIRTLALPGVSRARSSAPHAATLNELGAERVPLAVALAAAVAVSAGARLTTSGPELVELIDLPASQREPCARAGFEVTTVLGRPAAVWVRT